MLQSIYLKYAVFICSVITASKPALSFSTSTTLHRKYYEACTLGCVTSETTNDFEERVRYVSRVTYDGSLFKGWQYQDASLRTVQGVLSTTLSQKFQRKIIATGASRTDQGVHAHGQTIHFDLPKEILVDCKNLQFTLNRMLPDDLKVYNLSFAPEMSEGIFHATAHAKAKLYSYNFCTNQYVDPLKRKYCTHIYTPIEIDILQNCLNNFIGTFNFNAFGDHLEKSSKKNTNISISSIRTIYNIELHKLEEEGYYRVDFHIKSALYKMIRNIMGASILVGQGHFSIDHILYLLHNAPSRTENKAKAAPSEGLILEKVFYDNY